MFSSSYVSRVYDELAHRAPGETEFLQAVGEVFASIEPVVVADSTYEQNAILERLVEPDRRIIFRITWVDDAGRVQVNRGYRFEFNNALGPYKGGLRFHASVTPSIVKFLGFEQVFKNALTGLWMGGGKGGSDFDPHGRSEGEVMRFCQAYMTELYRYLGADIDVPAGDIGVGGREVGYMFGQYKRLTREFTGVFTGKGLDFGGSLVRTEATGYGLCYFVQDVLDTLRGDGFAGKTVVVSGSGNVAIYAAQKAAALGARVVTMSDSGGFIFDPDGIDLDAVKQLKLVRRARIAEYTDTHPKATFTKGANPWGVSCDIALPCATQGELDGADAAVLIKNGVQVVAEGANMPCTPEAIEAFRAAAVIYAPGKASNAGGVAVSGLEMAQDSQRVAWSFEDVDARLQAIMAGIVSRSLAAAREHGFGDDLLDGANVAGFQRVTRAMLAQGIY